ncbi:MAG: hypothetical protein HC800_05020 [Phormidesmis sp. RL_2_1]|nr:hypothetical protein [Phormidesmis sp. RL_2_1]
MGIVLSTDALNLSKVPGVRLPIQADKVPEKLPKSSLGVNAYPEENDYSVSHLACCHVEVSASVLYLSQATKAILSSLTRQKLYQKHRHKKEAHDDGPLFIFIDFYSILNWMG